MESAFSDCLKEKEARHHNNYHILFEEGAQELLMQFLPRRAIYPQSIAWLTLLSDVPIETPGSWRKELLKDLSHCPYSQPANISKRVLTETEEKGNC
jgi:hypothetical protein